MTKEVIEKLEFDKILSITEKYCFTNFGKEKIEKIEFLTEAQKIEIELKKVAEFKYILENYDFPQGYLPDLRAEFQRLKTKGTHITQENIAKLQTLLENTWETNRFLRKHEASVNFQNLKKLAQKLHIFPVLLNEIRKILAPNGEIKDSASKELKKIRQDITDLESQINKTLKKIFDFAQKRNYVAEDSPVIRNGKLVLPIIAHYKNKIKGIVVEQSESGKTLYIEPYAVVELNNKVKELTFREKREIIKILEKFTDFLRPYLDDLLKNYEILAEIDFIKAKAHLAIDLEAEEPQISDKPHLNLIKARHPLLFLNNKKQNKKTVPLSLQLNDNQRIIIISGANAGGKSVALKTVGLLQIMVQSGFLVSASLKSEFGIFDKIFVDIGDDQSIENDLSTYTSHLLRMKKILEQTTENSLVLIDEFGSGTDPTIGGAIAEAILEKLLEKKVKGIITTHYSNLKIFASENKGLTNAAVLFDTKNLEPLYILEIGHPGSSFALEIARKIGLDSQVINNAKQKLGKQNLNLEKIITDLQQQTKKLKQENEELNKVKKELKQKVIQYREEYEKLLKQKKKIISQAKQEAEQILDNANKLIENTISEIKSNKAEKNITKKIRQKFESGKQQIKNKLQKEAQAVENSLKQIKSKQKNKPTDDLDIKKGDFVKMKNSNLIGQVEAIKDNVAMVIMGGLRTYIPISKLEKASKPKSKEGVKIEWAEDKPQSALVLNIDVRGKTTEEALKKVEKFIDNAIVADVKEIRILHGTGDGILRTNIRAYLKNRPEIKWFGDADVRQGGQGITVVKF